RLIRTVTHDKTRGPGHIKLPASDRRSARQLPYTLPAGERAVTSRISTVARRAMIEPWIAEHLARACARRAVSDAAITCDVRAVDELDDSVVRRGILRAAVRRYHRDPGAIDGAVHCAIGASRCLEDPAAIACFSRTIARVRRIAQALIPAIPLVRIGLIQDVTRRDQEASADQRATAGVFNQSNWCSWHDGGRRKVTFVVLRS